MRIRRVLPLAVAGIAMSILAGALVMGIWHVGDAQCDAARHVEMLPVYGYPIIVDPCNDGWVAEWLAPAW